MTLLTPAVPDQVDPLLEACGEDPTFACRWVLERTDSRSWAEFADVVFGRPARILLIVVVAWVVVQVLRRIVTRFEKTMAGENPPTRRLKRRLRSAPGAHRLPGSVLATGQYSARSAARAETLGYVMRSVVSFAVWTIAVITILGELGLNLGPLIAGAGIAGVALGFGAQSLVKDFLAGVFILVEDQYGVGDVLDAGDLGGGPVIGTVEAVSLRATRMRSADGTVWHVPNGQIVRVGNQSQQWGQALVAAEVGPTADLDKAQRVVKDTADAMWKDPEWAGRIIAEPDLLGVEAVTPHGVTIQISLRTLPAAKWAVARELRSRTKQALDKAKIPPPVVPGVGSPGKK